MATVIVALFVGPLIYAIGFKRGRASNERRRMGWLSSRTDR